MIAEKVGRMIFSNLVDTDYSEQELIEIDRATKRMEEREKRLKMLQASMNSHRETRPI